MRCRKGDMAIVLRSYTDEVPIGSIVDVISLSVYIPSNWQISYRGNRFLKCGSVMCCEDKFLLPIRPCDLDETQETEKELTA